MEPTVRPSEQLRAFLKTVLRRTTILHLASGLNSFVAIGSWLLLIVVAWTAASSEPGTFMAHFMAWGYGIAVLALFGYFVVWPIIRMPRLNDLATEIEYRKDLREVVRAGFEFSTDSTASQRYSPALVKEVIRRAVDQVSGLQVRFLFLDRRDLVMVPIGYGGLAILLVLAIFNPSILSRAGGRVVDPAAAAAIAHRANIHAAPGDITVLAGSDVTVTGLDLGQTEDEVTIGYNIAEDFWKTEPADRVEDRLEGELKFERYAYTFRDLRHTLSYYFTAGDYESPKYTITVVHEPILTDLEITLTPPSYTGEEPQVLTDNGGNVHALEGTKVSVKARSNNSLAGAWVQYDGKDRKAVKYDDRSVVFGFTALEDGQYSVFLEDLLGYKTSDPLVYTVDVFLDNAPSLDVIDPGADTALPRNRKLNVGFIASDDYGVRTAAIFYRISGSSDFIGLSVPLGDQRGAKDVAVAYGWDLKSIELFPGNYIEYFVQVTDNNVVTGPGIAKSRLFQINVPTMADLYQRNEEDDAERTDMIEQVIKDSEEFRERIEKITREFIKTEKMEWTQKKEVDKALEKQKAIEEKLDDIKVSLDKTLEQLSENEMTSKEIGEKMEEIRELLDQIDSEALREYMEELREAVEKMSPEDVKEALENLELNAEEMLEKLERTAQLLKQIRKEQKMEELVRDTKELMDEQQALADETAEAEESDKDKMKELSDKQKELAKKAEQLKKKAEKLSKEMDDRDVSEELKQMAQNMSENDGPKKDMQKASKNLQEQQKSEAQQNQQDAMEKMISLFQKASKAQQQMQQNQGKRLAQNLQKFARQTLDLSFRQERLADKLMSGSGDGSEDYKQLAQDQMSYFKATEKVTNKIMGIAGMTMSISPSLMEALGKSLERMQNSVLFLEQNKPFMSTAHANNAVESLNQATMEMLRSAAQCSSGSPGGEGSSMAEQLMQQLIPQQRDVMQQTREMIEMNLMQEGLRQQRQAELERLAGQQRSLKEIAERIEKTMEEDRKGLGRLDRTIDEMEQVARALQEGRINENTVNVQQRILSRLLDAQRSVHTQDYEKKRESVTADDVFSRSLGISGKNAVTQSLREEIRRAMQLKAPGEFEDLIKLYFRALAEEATSGARATGEH